MTCCLKQDLSRAPVTNPPVHTLLLLGEIILPDIVDSRYFSCNSIDHIPFLYFDMPIIISKELPKEPSVFLWRWNITNLKNCFTAEEQTESKMSQEDRATRSEWFRSHLSETWSLEQNAEDILHVAWSLKQWGQESQERYKLHLYKSTGKSFFFLQMISSLGKEKCTLVDLSLKLSSNLFLLSENSFGENKKNLFS